MIVSRRLRRGILLAAALVEGTPFESKAAGNNEIESPTCLSETTIQVRADPARVAWPEASVVTWSVDFPSGCPNLMVRFNGQSVGKSGSRPVKPGRTSSFTISVGTFSQKSASATVEVTYPPEVRIDLSVEDPIGVLIGALVDKNNESQKVELCDVELDLTGVKTIHITGDRRSLIGSPGCDRAPNRLGPRIFVTDKRESGALFEFSGDRIEIRGFRLEGPTTDIVSEEVLSQDSKEVGIMIRPSEGEKPIDKIEISNMEIYQWAGSAIEVDDVGPLERGRLFNTAPAAVTIKGNFIHHNPHAAGFGYGVNVGAGAYATIEQNVFDENRHSITAGSRAEDRPDFSGYTASDNLILSGGGLHCADKADAGLLGGALSAGLLGALIGGAIGGLVGAAIGFGIGAVIGGIIGSALGGFCWHTQVIDMHGDGNLWYSKNNYECGRAGETILVQHNTILYYHDDLFEGHVIKIRGNPYDKAVVDGNVFRDPDSKHAISQNGSCGDNIITNHIDVLPNNIFGVDPTTELGSCDFFGGYEGGQQDQFMATGITWWANSPITHQWRYLNKMQERLAQLQLGDFDSDGVCDVAQRPRVPITPPDRYSKSGMGPWQPLHVIGP